MQHRPVTTVDASRLINRALVQELCTTTPHVSAPTSNALVAVGAVNGAVNALVDTTPPDSLGSLLQALAAVFSTDPELYLDDQLRSPVMHEFTEFVWHRPAVCAVLTTAEYLDRNALCVGVNIHNDMPTPCSLYPMLSACRRHHVTVQEVFAAQPAAYVGFLSLLTSLASGEKGAYVVFKLLAAAPSGALFSWQTNLGVMLQYCSRFRPPGTAAQDEGARAAAVSMPEVDAVALAAFARLLARVVEQGAREHVAVWLREMEEVVGVNPLWELLLQLLCYPVPSVRRMMRLLMQRVHAHTVFRASTLCIHFIGIHLRHINPRRP